MARLARRDFITLAATLKRSREKVRDGTLGGGGIVYTLGANDALTVMERNLIHFCEAESPTFDRDKFQKAARL